MTEEQRLLGIISEAICRAADYECEGACDNPGQAPGTPPSGYFEHAGRLLTGYGYTLVRKHLFLSEFNIPAGQKDQLCGLTAGPLDMHTPCTVMISEGMSPAREMGIIAHETAHVILGHPATTPAEVKAKNTAQATNYLLYGVAEIPEREIAAELAALTVVRSAGMPWPGVSMCYLHQRLGMCSPLGGVGESVRRDAVVAGGLLVAAMVPVVAEA